MGILEQNDDFQYYLITDAIGVELIKSYFDKSTWEAYYKLKTGAAKGDFLRYIALYIYGGVYLDLDNRITLSLSEMAEFQNAEYIFFLDDIANLENSCFMVSPKHPILLQIIEEMVKRIHQGEPNIFIATGPTLVTDIFYNEIFKTHVYDTNQNAKKDTRYALFTANRHYGNGHIIEANEYFREHIRVIPDYQDYMLYQNDKYKVTFNTVTPALYKNSIVSYPTKYGKITLYTNEVYIQSPFQNGQYWNEGTLLDLQKYVNPRKNIIEIGGHCGTDSLVFSSFLENQKVFVYEPQRKLYDLLVKNVIDNQLLHKIVPYPMGVFCDTRKGRMSLIGLDGGFGNVSKRYEEENHLPCNFGGIPLGTNGEEVELITVDAMEHDNIGLIYCSAQGSENFIFSKAIETIRRERPMIYYKPFGDYLYDSVYTSYPEYEKESRFDVKQFCIGLGYKECGEVGGVLLLP
jgi:FkbM family methyltransferase